MNNVRRKALDKIKAQVEELRMALDELLEEEQYVFELMPEGLQCSEKGEKMEEGISALEDAVGNLEECIDNIDTAIE